MVTRRFAALLLAASALPAGGCSDPPFVEMIHVEPLHGYEQSLSEFRQRRDAYFANDPSSPLLPEERESFAGLDYFDADEAYYFVGDLRLYAEPQTLQMVTTSGQIREAQRVGSVAFRVGGEPQQLQVYRLLDGSGGLFLPFQDGTTGTETYGAGRYVDLVPSAENGPYELDFNLAYNPSCAYGGAERFVCPVTPLENRLVVRIEAGERGRADVHVEGAGG